MLLLSEESGRLSTRGHLKYDDLTLDCPFLVLMEVAHN